MSNKLLNKTRRNKSYGSNIAFIDLLFNTLIGFIFLFIIAFLLINPVAKQADIELKAEFFITLSWPTEYEDDVDLWVKTPNGDIVGYTNRESGITSLDFDDLGNEHQPANAIYKNINEEHVTIKGIIPGEWIVNVHLYRKDKNNTGSVPVVIILEDVNPYGKVIQREITLEVQGEEVTAFRFLVDQEGTVIDVNQLSYNIYSDGISGRTEPLESN